MELPFESLSVIVPSKSLNTITFVSPAINGITAPFILMIPQKLVPEGRKLRKNWRNSREIFVTVGEYPMRWTARACNARG